MHAFFGFAFQQPPINNKGLKSSKETKTKNKTHEYTNGQKYQARLLYQEFQKDKFWRSLKFLNAWFQKQARAVVFWRVLVVDILLDLLKNPRKIKHIAEKVPNSKAQIQTSPEKQKKKLKQNQEKHQKTLSTTRKTPKNSKKP